MSALQNLQTLLRDLFQLDSADLDFGIYRLFRIKHDEIEAFLSEQLPRRVGEAFQTVADEERAALERDVADLASRIRREVAEDALSERGEPQREHPAFQARLARELLEAYEGKRRALEGLRASEAQQAEVFNHLYAFFSRYYESGDFIPRRRYGAREAYAVPYNGEEVLFHWANKDQHYVKTAEALRDYAFTVEALGGPYRIRFALTEASLPPGNTKGESRYFFPHPKESEWVEDKKTFRLPFHYRLPTEAEVEQYGRNSRLQEAVLQAAEKAVLRAVPLDLLRSALATPVDPEADPPVSLLLKRLRHFTRRQTSDYFIHRDLRGFLERELEFYLKDQVLHLGDLEGDLESKRRTLRVIRTLAGELIEFLAQIEDVQKRLFEKRKFILRTDYLAPLQNVPRDLWPKVVANEAQIEAWKDLFAVERKDLFKRKGEVNLTFLQEHPTLVVDTRHFDAEFTERLLAGYDDLDEATDGLLIHSENYQALRLLQPKYTGRVKCIYIDPPYNSATSEIPYKNSYKHSSWLSLMEVRLELSSGIATLDGIHVIAIDENEQDRLTLLLKQIFPNREQTIVSVVHNPRGIQGKGFSYSHDYAVFVLRSGAALPKRALLGEKEKPLLKTGSVSSREEGRNMFYPVYCKGGRVVRIGEVPSDDRHPGLEQRLLPSGEIEIWPVDSQGGERKWRYKGDSLADVIDDLEVRPGRDGRLSVYLAKSEETYRTVWSGAEYNAAEYGSNLLKHMNLPGFGFPKSLYTVLDCVRIGLGSEEGVVLDYFAGSGTTGHAAISLVREDGVARRFVLVEFAGYFDTVLLPRIQKVIFAPEWKDGRPQRLPTPEESDRTPRLVKVLRLEGYEDALHNLATDATLEREAPRAKAFKERVGPDAYRLRYLARLPLEASASLLDLAALEHPFGYTIEVLTEDGPKTQSVDLVETFNFLYGLHVERLQTWTNPADDRRYRAVRARRRDERKVLVLWRDMSGLDPAAERVFLEAKVKEMGPFEEVLINGDCATPGVHSLDPLFKRLLEEGER